MRRVRARAVVVAIGVVVAVALVAPTVRADEPPYVPWPTLLPGFTTRYDPGSSNDCNAGRLRCVDSVIAELQRRLDAEAATCDHAAVFDLGYLRMSEEFRRTTTAGPFFDDPAFMNHHDAVFAHHYFAAKDAWDRGDLANVPPAWQLAFQVADDRSATALGDFMLAISAHVNRDLPFVLEEIGLVRPDGTNRKADEDRIDEILNRAISPAIDEVAARFDSTIDDILVPGTAVTETAIVQALFVWRERAYRYAEALVNAPTPEARAVVAAAIDQTAVVEGWELLAVGGYQGVGGLFGSNAARDSYCATHHG
jgi:hypothetical protein